MKIAIASTGRFHVLDLARELVALGHEVTFYSYVPKGRAKRFGLAAENCVSVLPLVFPFVALSRFAARSLRGLANCILAWLMDWIVAWKLRPCDVFIGMSGIYLRAPLSARRRYGAAIFVERGSRHIASQKEIVEDLHVRGVKVERVPAFFERRELMIYDQADRIVVPSKHVERSFTERGVAPGRIFRNPYGVGLEQFSPTAAPAPDRPTALFVGTWSYRKGADLLVEAWKSLDGIRLVHVGPIGDAPLPVAEWFDHVGPVDQNELSRYYAHAHLFVLASREEGLSMVIAQALSCGLPVVCTDRTGGEDLRDLLSDPEMMAVVPAGEAGALSAAVSEMMTKALALRGVRDLVGARREELSWAAYGKRYHAELAKYGRTDSQGLAS